MTYDIDERNPEIGENEVLEALKRARLNITGAPLSEAQMFSDRLPWKFSNWSSCTCGHIYLAATGERGRECEVTQPRRVDGLYEEAMKAVIRANPEARAYAEEVYVFDPLAVAVSNATTDRARKLAGRGDDDDVDDETDYQESRRRGALDLIDRTITYIETGHEAARQKLLNKNEEAS